MADHIYVGSGKERTFDNGGSVITVSIDVDKLINACKDHGYNSDAGKRYIKLKVGRRREIDQYGNSHSVEVDTWKPDGNRHESTQTGASGAGYQKRPGNASAAPSGSCDEDIKPPDYPDSIPF